MSHVRHQSGRHELDSLKGDIRNPKPPYFDGERKTEDDDEVYLFGIRKYF